MITYHNVEIMSKASEGTARLTDIVICCWPEFAKAVDAVSDELGLPYYAVRSVVIRYYQSQKTFHLAAIAEMVRKNDGSHAAEVIRGELASIVIGV